MGILIRLVITAVSLWIATLVIDVNRLSADELERMVKSVTWVWVADWLHSYVVAKHPDKESLRQQWMAEKDPMAARDIEPATPRPERQPPVGKR